MPVIPVNKVVDSKRIIGKNGGPRSRRGTRGSRHPPKKFAQLMMHKSCSGFFIQIQRIHRRKQREELLGMARSNPEENKITV
jgi:hypothetical protein